MLAHAPSYAQLVAAMENRHQKALQKARAVILSHSLRILRNAEVVSYSAPDVTNPGGYSHRWVYLEYRTWFGMKWSNQLYAQMTAYDETEQELVQAYASRLLAAINAANDFDPPY